MKDTMRQVVALAIFLTSAFFQAAPIHAAGSKDAPSSETGLSNFCIYTRYKDLNLEKYPILRLRVPNSYLIGAGSSQPTKVACFEIDGIMIAVSFPELKALTSAERENLGAFREGKMLLVRVMNFSGTNIALERRILEHEVGKLPNIIQIDSGDFDSAFKWVTKEGVDTGTRYYFKRENGGLTSFRCRELRGAPRFCDMAGTHRAIPNLTFSVSMHGDLMADYRKIRQGVEKVLSDIFVQAE